MKLRNKDTGEIVEFITIDLVDDNEIEFTYVRYDGDEKSVAYRTLKNFNNEWEDYEPKEPLIKDEKIRKAVRAWAEANDREYLLVIKSGGRLEISDGSPHLIYISFHVDNDTLKILDDRTYYPIEELCGEEEE